MSNFRILSIAAACTALLPIAVSAQSTTASATRSSASSTGAPKIHTVGVGSSGHGFFPNITYADVGDIVVFQFYPTNHSVIRTEYTGWEGCLSGGCNPCVPYELYHNGTTDGFHSGNMITNTFSNPPTFNITIKDTKPIWFYCNAIDSCRPNGMVGAINPSESQNITLQAQRATSALYQLAPGDSWPAEAEGYSKGEPTASISSTSAASTATSSPTVAAATSTHHGLSKGAIAGIAVGAVVGVLLVGALIWFMSRSHAYSKVIASGSTAKSTSSPSEAGRAVETVQTWNEKNDMRFSGTTTAYPSGGGGWSSPTGGPPGSPGPVSSPVMSGGQFVGYNRQTGEPEFATEAPMMNQVQEYRVSGVPERQHGPVELDAGSAARK